MSIKLNLRLKGGPGSGHRGHAGRPGQRGGSVSGAGGKGGEVSGPTKLMANTDYELHTKRTGRRVIGSQFEEIVETYEVSDERLDDLLNAGLEQNYMGSETELRGRVKREIVERLSDESNLEPDTVNQALRNWADTSNDTDPHALALQRAVSEEFDVPLSEWQKSKVEKVGSYMDSPDIKRYGQESRTLLRSMYDITQRDLATAGYGPDDTVTLFRGVYIGKSGLTGPFEYKGNAMESWSVSPTVAMKFRSNSTSAYVLAASIPVRNILSTARTGFGCLNEGEVVVFGSIPNSEVAVAKSTG